MESDPLFLQQTSFNISGVNSFESSYFLTLDKTVEVNQPRDNVYIFTCLPILFLALIVNSLAVVVIWRKEQTGLNSLIICDCLVNMVTMFLSVVHQSPWFIGWPRWMCQTYAFTQQSLITWNRLLPVGCCCILNQYFLFILFNINIMKKSQTRENLIKL